MTNDYDDLKSMISSVVKEELKYAVPRLGQVLNVNDDEQKGRILVSIPAFGWDTQDKAEWCYPKDKKSLITPKLDDWVIVEWIDGDANKNAVYSGNALWMKNQTPKAYDGKPKTQVLFEDNDKLFYISYNEQTKAFKFSYSDSIVLTLDFITGKMSFEGSLVDLLGATESFIKGDTMCAAFTALCASIAAIVPSNPVTSAQFAALQAAFSTFNGQITNFKSTTIKGE